ncbi:MAG: SDR family oxidoreductase [Deltaproteobacteria bacterium]|nr:SDR family oxidoreductase [Deltaproteobacteria bacterium]
MSRVLVVGATGKVGREAVHELSSLGATVLAATRRPADYRGPNGVQPVELDLDRPGTWDDAVRGVTHLFLMARPGDPRPEATLVPLFERARTAELERVALLSILGADRDEDLGVRKVEKHLAASGVPWTFLRPNWFMQNFSDGFLLDSIKAAGGIYLPVGDAKVSYIDTRDVGQVGARAILEDRHVGRAYALTGPRALDHAEAASILSRTSGRTIAYVPIGEDDARKGMLKSGWPAASVDFFLRLMRGMRAGDAATVSPDVRSVLGREPITFEQFADRHASQWR